MSEDLENLSNDSLEIIEASEKADGYSFLGSTTERMVFLIFLTILSCGPIIFGKSIPSHADWHIHIEHAYNFKKCFFEGQWLPRWLDAHTNGYGLPIFNFYAPLIYYFYSFINLFFRDPIISIKISFVMPMILCTIFGYLYLRKHGSPIATTLAMPFVIFSPAIHIFIYNTNWPGSTLAIAFLFLALYAIDSFDVSKNIDLKNVLILAFSYCCLALTHLASAFVFTLLSVPYFILNLFIYKSRNFIKNFFLGMALGGGLSAFYLFPAALEKKYVHTDEVLTQGPLWDFSKNFLFTYLDRNKDEGFAWAIFDHRYYEVSNALFGLAVFICLLVVLINLDNVKKYFQDSFKINSTILMFIISFLMMTPISIFIWLLVKPLQTIQFPWRFTAFLLPFGALIIVYAFDLMFNLNKNKISVVSSKIIYSFLIIIFAILSYVDFINMYNWKWVPEESLMKAAMYISWGNEEYMPNIVNNPKWKEVNYRQDFSPTISSSNNDTQINLVDWKSHHRIFNVFSSSDHQMRLRLFYFPGWNVLIDGKPTELRMDSQSGVIVFQVPGGQHQIVVKFDQTPIRKIGSLVSILSFVIFLLLLFKPKFKLPEKKLEVEAI